MTTARKTREWALELSAIREQLEAGKLSAREAVEAVWGAYGTFLRETYTSPTRWYDKEADEIWQARPWRDAPAAELTWWANSLRNKKDRRKTFFTSQELWAAIEAIGVVSNNERARKYGPTAWYWEP